MRWKKLGRIFNPDDFNLGAGIVGFAQGPQALVFDGFVRIYFSTRKLSSNGKFTSYIRFVDVDKSFREIIRVSTDDVIEEGALGTFDEHGIFPMNVLRVNDCVYAYTCGWSRRTSVSIDMAIGFAISKDDGLSFQRLGAGPVLTASLHEPFLVGDPFVKHYEKQYHMWYIYGLRWKTYGDGTQPDRIYKIGHATSVDGMVWVKDERRNIIVDRLGDDECQALPSVVKIGSRYHMFFCYRQASDFRKNSSRAYRIGHAYSDDLSLWTRNDDVPGIDVSNAGWDSEMLCYPHVFECDGKIYLLYNGNEFGKFGFGISLLEFETA